MTVSFKMYKGERIKLFFINVTMESVWMCYAWESVCVLVQWQCHQSLCQMLYDHQPGTKIPIPPCPEDTHPLQIFEETHVDDVCLMVKSASERVAMVSNHSKGASQHGPHHTDLMG